MEMQKWDSANELENLRLEVKLAEQRLRSYSPDYSDWDDEFACYLDRQFLGTSICNMVFKPSEILWKCNRDLYEEEQENYVNAEFKKNPMQFELYAILHHEYRKACSELNNFIKGDETWQ